MKKSYSLHSCFAFLALFCLSTKALAQSFPLEYDHQLDFPEIPNCAPGTQKLAEGIYAEPKAGQITKVRFTYNPADKDFTGEFTTKPCGNALPTGMKFFLTDGGAHELHPAVVIDASPAKPTNVQPYTPPNSNLKSNAFATIVDDFTGTLLASNHPSYTGDKGQILLAQMEDATNGTRIFRIHIDVQKINASTHTAGWKGISFTNHVAYWAFPLTNQENAFCVGAAGEPARCARQLGFYRSVCWINGQYDIHGQPSNTLPVCAIYNQQFFEVGVSIPHPEGQCIPADAGATKRIWVAVVDPDQNQKKFVEILEGQGTLMGSANSIGRKVDATELGAALYQLDIPATGAPAKYLTKFQVSDNGNPLAVNGYGSDQCQVEICPVDECPSDPYKTKPGICGCGKADVTTDKNGDGKIDAKDCTYVPPSPTPSPTPSVTPKPSPSPSGTPKPTPTATPTVTPSVSPSPSPTPTATPTLKPSPTPSAPPKCDSQDVTNLLFALDSTVASQHEYLKQALQTLSKVAKGQGAFIRAARKEGNDLYLSSWNITWSIPKIINNCEPHVECVTVSQTESKAGYISNVERMDDLIKETVRRIRRAGGKENASGDIRGARLLERSADRVAEAHALIQEVPDVRSDCSSSKK